MFIWLQAHTPTRHVRHSDDKGKTKHRIHANVSCTRLVKEALALLPEDTEQDLELHVLAGLVVKPQSAPSSHTYVTPAVREVARYWEAFIGELTPVITFEIVAVLMSETPVLPWFKGRGVCNFVVQGPHVPPRVLCEVTDATAEKLLSSTCQSSYDVSELRMTVREAMQKQGLWQNNLPRFLMTCPVTHAVLLQKQIWTSYSLPVPQAVAQGHVTFKSRWLMDALGLDFLTRLTSGLVILTPHELRPQTPDSEEICVIQEQPMLVPEQQHVFYLLVFATTAHDLSYSCRSDSCRSEVSCFFLSRAPDCFCCA